MKYLTFLITLPLTAFCAYLILFNDGEVSFSYFPGFDPWSITLGILAAALLGCGFFCGALFVWLHAQKAVYQGWKEKRRADRLEKELEQLHKKEDPAAIAARIPPRKLTALSFLQGK